MKLNRIMMAAACLIMASCAAKNNGVTLDWIPDAEPDLKPAALFGDVPQEIVSELNIENGVPSSMSAFLLRNGKSNILFDAGMGNPGSLLIPALEKLGVAEGDVNRIFITHMHPDHIGGIMSPDKFPNAEIWIPEAEYKYWQFADSGLQAAFLSDNADRIHVFTADEKLGDGITAIPAPGHTPGHTIYQVDKYLIIGDLMHGAALQMAHPEYNARFDMDQEASLKSRKEFVQYAKDNGLTMAGMHLPAPGFINPAE